MLGKFKIGHYTNSAAGTGCTVIIPPEGNMASAAIGGASPGTRELALLSPKRKISHIHALVLTGGSAFGLGCAQGVMEELAAKKIGYETNYGVVPIVPAAVIFDKNLGDANAYPKADDGRQAFSKAEYNNKQMGNVGAGTAASVGKWRGMQYAMKSGLGIASQTFKELRVTVLTVVNAAADILDYDHSLLAGAVDAQGRFWAKDDPFSRWENHRVGMAENTVLSVVMTNMRVTKQQAFYLAEHAQFGIARRVEPSHTSYDGDICFFLSSQELDGNLDLLAGMIVPVVEASIINGVKYADSAYGLKSVNELQTGK